MADMTVTLRITADGKAAVKVFGDVEAAEKRIGAAGKAAGAAAAQGANQAARSFEISGKAALNASAEISRAKATLIDFAAIAAGLHFGRQFLSGIAEASRAMDGWRNGLLAATGSTTAASDALAFVRSESERLGISLEAGADGFTKLSAAARGTALEGQGARDVFSAVSEAARALNLSSDQTAGALTAIQQMMSKGTVSAEELRGQLGERLPGAFNLMAQALDVSTQQLGTMLEQGEVLADHALPLLAERLHEVYGAAASTAADSPAAAIERMKNAWMEFLAALGDAGVMDALAAAANVAASTLRLLADHAELVATVLAGAFATGVVHATKLLGGWIAGLNAAAVASQAGVGVIGRLGSGLLAFAGGPVGVAIIAVSALAAGLYALSKAEKERQREFQAGIDNLHRSAEAARDLAAGFREITLVPFQPLPEWGDTIKQYAESFGQLTDAQERYNRKRAELDAIEKRLEVTQGYLAETAPQQLASMTAQAGRLREEMAAMEPALNALRTGTDELGAVIDTALTPAVNEASAALDRLLRARSFDGIVSAIGDGIAAVSAQFGAVGVNIGEWNRANAALNQSLDGVKAKLETHGKTTAQIIAAQFEAVKSTALWTAASEQERAALTELVAQRTREAESMEKSRAARSAGRDAAAEAARAAKEHATAITELARALSEQRAELSPMDAAMESYKQRITDANVQVAEWLKAGLQWADVQAYLRGEIEGAGNALSAQTAELAKQGDVLGNYLAEVADQKALIGMTARQKAVADAVRQVTKEYEANTKGGIRNAQSLGAVQAGAAAAAGELFDLQESAEGLEDILSRYGEVSGFESLIADIDEMGEALKTALENGTDTAGIERMQRAMGALRQEALVYATDTLGQGIASLQSMATEGTRAYKALEVAQTALNLATAIGAIANQGMGDPYTAFARIAAMAALMSQLVDGLSALGSSGPSSSSAEVRQQTQGTGTVLGDSDAKSESILRATEITANATEQLVGLNRGMLNALLALQDGLVGAAGLIARGAGDVEFADVSSGRNILNPFGKDPLGGALGNLLFGGKKSIIDQGIIIAGGTLQEMLENIVVGAYQTIKTDGGLFGSDKIKDDVVDISGEFGTQFQLVIGSIIDTVREGALALGLLPDDIEAAIAAFRVEEIRISLKGLSAEEQQAELEAVFSSIFDGLAGSVVPFIEQFQQVGEGLGETLVRIATEVQVAQEAFRQFGMVIDQSDPERFAQIADGLVQAVGGLDEFISGMQSFVANFAPEAHQFTVASDALSSAFDQVGLSVPATRDGMWELMQSLDATTEEGREQIATLLRLADTAAEYYDLLEQRTQDAIETLDGMGLGPNSGLSEFGRTLQGIEQSSRDAIDAANALAQAEGREGASTRQLAAIHRWTAQQIAAAIRQLQAETQDLIAQLYGGEFGTLDALDARISELEGATGSWSNSIGDVASASDDLFERWRSGIESVQDYLDSMLLGDLSALTPEDQLAEAQRQLLDMQAAAMSGDADALANLPQLADAYLRMLREYEASGEDYNAGFDWVRDLLQSVVGLENPGTPNTDAGSSGGGGGQVVSPELQELYEQRDRLLAEQELAYRAQLAQDLTQHLADLAYALNVPILELIEAQGVNLQSLATDLGVNLQDLTASSVEALGIMASTLGISMTELTGALGLSLTDLAGGLTELTEQVGIDLGALTVESTQSLAALAASLGMDLSEFAIAVGTDLGSLADSQSLLNEALEAEINALPEAQRDQLAPLLEAVENATTEADANAAIAELEDAVNALGGETANALAPYLDGVFPPQALDQLDYLGELRSIAADQLSELMSIYDALRDGNRAADVPGYAVGTGYVPKTGLAMIHEGEAIIPAPFAAWLRDNGLPVMHAGAANDDGRVAAEVRALREEVAALRRDNSAGHARTAQAVTDGDAKARQQRDDIARRNETIIRRTA